jgi:NAD(P)-dependent dehydrogenase (short-subunit alcohol dehydrogenase family)
MAKFGAQSTAEQVSEGVDLSGRSAVVTGASTGIGLEAARVLALRGAHVVMACRNLDKAGAARERLIAGGAAPDRLEIRRLDLASLESVRAFSRDLLADNRPLPLLLNNAGLFQLSRQETSDGFEMQFGVNHLGHFLLTNLLLERIRSSAPARIVSVSSGAMHFASLTAELDDPNWEKRRYRGWRAYGDSKLMNLLFTGELARRLEGSGVVAHAVHPGGVRTELGRDAPLPMRLLTIPLAPFLRSPARGAATPVWASVSPECAKTTGGYFADCAPARAHALAGNRDVEARLWARSAELTRIA